MFAKYQPQLLTSPIVLLLPRKPTGRRIYEEVWSLAHNILAKDSNNDARFILGKLMVEGSSEKVQHNENKGINWIKEASKQGSQEALEYKTYWDIRFDKAPNL